MSECKLPGLSDIPNVLTEALTRKAPVLSFPHDQFRTADIRAAINGNEVQCANWVNAQDVNLYLFRKGARSFGEYLAGQQFALKTEFVKKSNGRYCVDDGFEDGRLSISDGLQLCEMLQQYILEIRNGKINKKQTDQVIHKGRTYYEFRLSLSSDRIFRIYYARRDERIIFMNSLLKKTQKIPTAVKEESVRIFDQI